MKYGYFDDAKREYVITTPKTPLPWINYLGTNGFFSLVSNTGGGYCFYKDAKLRRILRYRLNNVPADNGGRYFYINDGGDVWTPSFMPVKKELDFYECRHGIGYTSITGERNGISVNETFFVPVNDACEIHRVKIKNTSSSKKTIKMFSYVEFCLWDALDDMLNFQRNLSLAEAEIEGSAIYHKTEYRERRDHYAFYSVNAKIDGYETDRDTFLGAYNGFDTPETVINGKAQNSSVSGWYPIASHMINIELECSEEKEFIFVLGYIENERDNKFESHCVINKTKAKEMQLRYSTSAQCDKAFSELGEYWDKLLSIYTIKSNDEKLDRMVNIWNPYQCMVTFNMSRSASYFESGIGRGMGFRDSNQDLIGFVHQIPERARERIIDLASTQHEDGSAYHQYQPLTKKGNNDIGSGFNDDPLWLVLGVIAYIKETGDFSILEESVPFDSNKENTASLLEHLNRSFNHVVENLGPHGLPLIGRADWNDCINLNCHSTEPGESFQTFGTADGRVAESVFIAGMFVFIGNEFANLYKALGNSEMENYVRGWTEKMSQTVEAYGYDGEWFLRAYDAFGNKVGSNECEEGKIFIEPQGFCVMAGIGKDNGKAEKALDSVKNILEYEYGITLHYPPYTVYHTELGEITSFLPGYKENGGVFCHNNPWIMIAETVLGRGERAFEVYKKIAPAYIEDISDIHRTEPYVYSQMIAGMVAPRAGEAKNSWLTGTAAWNYVAISQYILGIRPEFDGLRVEPCLAKEITSCTINRKYRGTEYIIDITNNGTGKMQITVDGEEVTDNIIVSDKPVCKVKVVM